MTQLARGGRMHETSRSSFHAALFGREELELLPAEAYTDEDRDWNDPVSLEQEPALLPGSRWSWHGPRRVVTGPSWGGCLEIVDLQLRTGRYLRPVEDYADAILLLETSEETPPAALVHRTLMAMGERGLLGQFAAVLVGRPKAWSFEHPRAADEKERYRRDQADAVVRAVREYNPAAPVVVGLDVGHTDPQYVVPHGGLVTVDAVSQRVRVAY